MWVYLTAILIILIKFCLTWPKFFSVILQSANWHVTHFFASKGTVRLTSMVLQIRFINSEQCIIYLRIYFQNYSRDESGHFCEYFFLLKFSLDFSSKLVCLLLTLLTANKCRWKKFVCHNYFYFCFYFFISRSRNKIYLTFLRLVNTKMFYFICHKCVFVSR
jgi:hypothetical protein